MLSEAQKVVMSSKRQRLTIERERDKEGTVDRSEGLGNESLCNLTLRLSAETVREMRLRAATDKSPLPPM